MNSEIDWDRLRAHLVEHHQEHLLVHLDKLSKSEQAALYEDITSVDFQKLSRCWASSQGGDQEVKDERLKPLDDSILGSTAHDEGEMARWSDIGLRRISEGKVAAILLAGGQGTRLGVSYPKGMYNVGLPSRKTLYQLQAERICRLQNMAGEKYGTRAFIPWYLMTSDYTKEPTREFFQQNSYFGLKPENVILFEQYTLPCLDNDGRILLTKKHALARSPDGNGGLYTALASPNNTVLADMEARGIEFIHVYCVDNILVKVADPVFIGFCEEKEADCGAKVVERLLALEKVGLICYCDDHYQVVEYSEVSSRIAEMREKDGSLTFKAGNICNHFFTLQFLNTICREHEDHLRHHIAKKKIPHINASGDHVTPDSPNGIKMEKFVFDVFQFSKKFAVLEVQREDEFSPLKNGPGADKNTPITSRDSLMNLHYRQLIKAGASLTNGEGTRISQINDGKEHLQCEISPLVSYCGEGLEDICRGCNFKCPIHITNGHDRVTNSNK